MNSSLSRSLGLPMLVFYGTGMILGAGIYSIIGKAAGPAGETLWWGFVFAGVAALLTAFSYAELSSMYPKAGAEYIYLSHAFQNMRWLATTAGIAMALSGAATAATVAIAFTGYLGAFVEGAGSVVTAALLVTFTIVAIVGVRFSGWTNVVFTLIEISGLLIIVYLGFYSEKFGEALSAVPHEGTMAGAALIIFSYFGFENIVNLAEESKNPERHLPKAIFISLGLSTVLYVLVGLSVVALLSPDALAESDAALMSAAQTVSPKAASVLGGIALFSTANTALIALVGASRILYGMGKAGALPSKISNTLPKRKTPWIASLVILVAALLLLPLAKVETVASVSSLMTMLAFTSVNIALIKLRFSGADRERPFKVPLHIGRWPVLPIMGALLSLLFVLQFERVVYLVGGGFLAVTIVATFLFHRMQNN